MRSEPTAGTYAEALAFFADRPGVEEAWLELASAGASVPARMLRGRALSAVEVRRLCAGVLTPELVLLLGDQGELAREAAPRLRALLPDPGAAMALARIGEEVELAEIFLEQTDHRVQERLVLSCRNPERLAEKVLPGLRQRWHDSGPDRSVLWALGAFRQHAARELPWLLELLTPSGEWCSDAIAIVGQWGEAARPAFASLALLLDHTDHRGPVLKALQELGPVAREEFLPLLEVLELESERWLVWQRNWWILPLRAALTALQ